LTPAVFVIGRCSLTQHLNKGSLPWFWCACSACTEKPKKIKRHPLCLKGSKTSQHGILAGVLLSSDQRLRSIWYGRKCDANLL